MFRKRMVMVCCEDIVRFDVVVGIRRGSPEVGLSGRTPCI